MASAAGLSEADQKELQSFLDTEQAKARVQKSVSDFTEVSLSPFLHLDLVTAGR